MKKVLLFLSLLFFAFPLYAGCTQKELDFYALNFYKYNEFYSSNQESENFHCWEIAYLINSGQNLTVAEYEQKMSETIKQYFPNDNKSISYFRELGDVEDLIYFASVSNVKNESDKNFNSAYNLIQKFVLNNEIIINNTSIIKGENTCSYSTDISDLNAKLPMLKKISYFDAGYNARSFTGKPTGNLIFKNPLQNENMPQQEAILQLGKLKYDIQWDAKCNSQGFNLNGLIKVLTSNKIILSLFKTITKITTATYDFMINIAFYLLPIFLTLWLMWQGFKMFNPFGVIEGTAPTEINGKNLLTQLMEMCIYSAIFFLVFTQTTPTQIVNFVFAPILNIGLFVGDKILSIAGFSMPIDFFGGEAETLMFENTSMYISNYLATIGRTNGQIIAMGWHMIWTGSFFTGLVLILLFLQLTWKYVKMLIGLILDIILAIIFLPLYGLCYVFPATRGYAKGRTLDVFENTAYALATIPIYLVVNTMVVKVFMTKNLSYEEMQALQNINDAEFFARATNELSFVEVIFMAFVITWFFSNCEKWLGEIITPPQSNDTLFSRLNTNVSNIKKRVNEAKKTVKSTNKIKIEKERIEKLKERMKIWKK